MLKYSEFTQLIRDYVWWTHKIDDVSDVLNAPNLFECDWVSITGTLFDFILKQNFTDTGVDIINWWVFERDEYDPEPQMSQTVNGEIKEIPTRTVDDLWSIVKGYRK